ncbi:MAG: polyketide synthase, partial [Myxococcales bacterium]|nr:polyketide synthase [Myxococcales bacterium]
PDADAPGRSSTRWGAFLDEVAGFDAGFFNITPREAERMDPQQRLSLEVCWEALEDAGIPPHGLRGRRVACVMGAMWSDYAGLHGIEQISAHSGTGWQHGGISGRISHCFGFRGPSMTVDTSCSSSLVAVHLACRSLLEGEGDLAIAGGVSLMLDPRASVIMSKFGGLSPADRCWAYDARACGYVRGEGAGV